MGNGCHPDGGEQLADFYFDLIEGGDCLRDFLAQEVAVTAAEAVYGFFDGASVTLHFAGAALLD